jgi:hypothetical protein
MIMEEKFFKIPPKEVQQAIVDRIIMRIDTRNSSFTREDVIEFAKEAKTPAIYASEVLQVVIEDLANRVFSRLYTSGMIVPIQNTKYYRKRTQQEMDAAKKAYLKAVETQENEEEDNKNDEIGELN